MRRRSRRSLGLASFAALLATLASPAAAQMAPAEVPASISEPLPTPGRALASNDDASALATNPGNLAFLPEPELRWTWLYAQETSTLPGRGHAIDVAAPFWILASGLRLELVDPPRGARAPFRSDYQWVRWGLGARVDDWLGFGAGLGWSISESSRLDGQFGATLGLTIRPSEWLSTSYVLRDFNVPTARNGSTVGSRIWETGLAVRPIDGLRDLEVGLEARYYEQLDRGSARATLGVDVPYVGRLRGDVQWVGADVDDPQLVATAGLDVNWGPMQLSGGGVFGNAIGMDRPGFYVSAAMRGHREPGVPHPSFVAKIEIDEVPGVRGHVRLLRKLWRLADRDDVDGVLLVLRDEPASSLAHAEEVADAIRTLRARGKKVACHLEDSGGRSLFVCSQADRIAIHPAGGLRFAGLSNRYYYFGGLLERLGVDADFVRIGAHKSAAEQFTLERGTDVARRDHQSLVDRYDELFLHDVGGGRRIPVSRLRDLVAKGPYLAREARAAGLVDTLVYPDELGAFMEEVMGRPVSLLKKLPFTEAPERWTRDERIAIVYLAGDMVDGESKNIPLVGIRLAGSRTISDALKEAREDPRIKAVVFRIETGGGSSLAADVILREAQLTAKRKPMVISMGSAAASGGYYAAVGGGTIWANRSTITGSIGIFYGKVDVSGLLGKLGVGQDVFRSAPRADAQSLFRPFTDDERADLATKVKELYDLFVGRVAEGRSLPPEAVDAVARGRVWTGAEAKERALVDRVGGLRAALDEARRLADVDPDTPLVELPEEDDSLLGFLLDLAGVSAGDTPLTALIPPAMLDAVRALAPFYVYESDRPLARVEVFEEGGYPARFGRERAKEDD